MGETRESFVFKMADEMLQKLPENFLQHKVHSDDDVTVDVISGF